MDIVNENAYVTTDLMNLKNKQRTAFSSSKKALSDVRNTIHLKNMENNFCEFGHDLSTFSKSQLPIVLKRDFKSPEQIKTIAPKSSNKFDWNTMDDHCFTSCRCIKEMNEDDFVVLPEDLRLTKQNIDEFATKWSNICDSSIEDVFSISSFNEGDLRNMMNLVLGDFSEDMSSVELLEKSYEINVPTFEDVLF